MKNNKWFYTIINIFYCLSIITLIGITIFTCVYIVSPNHMFSAITNSNGWLLSYNYFGIDNSIVIKYSILNKTADIVQAKPVMIISWILLAQILSGLSYFIMKVIRDISHNNLVDKRPFELYHVKQLRQIGLYVLQLSLILQLGLNIALNIITSSQGFQLESLIYLPGFLIAGLFYLMSEIFSHGHKLQDEHDHTL